MFPLAFIVKDKGSLRRVNYPKLYSLAHLLSFFLSYEWFSLLLKDLNFSFLFVVMFGTLELLFLFVFVVATCDLVHDVKTIYT